MNTTDMNKVWDNTLTLLSCVKETSSPLAKVWLEYLVPHSLDDERFTFAVKLLQAKPWIEQRYLSYIEETIATVLEGPREIVLIVDETIDRYQSGASSFAQLAQNAAQGTVQGMAQGAAQNQGLSEFAEYKEYTASFSYHAPQLSSQLSSQQAPLPSPHFSPSEQGSTPPPLTPPPLGYGTPYSTQNSQGSALGAVFASESKVEQAVSNEEPSSRFSFSNYVMGNSNEFAYKASLRVAEAPGLYFNPLFIYGRSGLGKTHLLLSIRNYINTYLPDKRVVYAPITEFVNDFTNAMAKDRDLSSFKRKYHTCDVLLVDDVQNLEGKEGTTDALFEIFNIFIENKKQIVLSADRSPREIKIDERFTSRFAQGITADIQPPNYEMKTAILKNYKRYYCNFLTIPEVEFSDEAVQKIVELSGSNIRELEGAVSNLIVYASCKPEQESRTPITYREVESVLGSSFFHKNTRRVDFDMIMKAVESYFKVSRAELLSEKRSKNISYPRQIAMYLMRRYTDMSYPDIGGSFNKDHTTAMYADKNIQAKMVEEASVKTEVERLSELLTA